MQLSSFFDLFDGQMLVDWLQTRGITILAIILISWFAYHFAIIAINRFIDRVIRKNRFNAMTDDDVKKRRKTISSLLGTLSRTIITLIGIMMVTQQLFPNINYAPLFASAGIIGVAIGFGAQSLIKDFLTGIFIISENQYRVGDVVDIDSAAGTVEKLGIRSTVVRDVDGNVHYMPNGNITHVINKTMGFSRVHFTLAVAPDSNVDTVAQVINEVGEKLAEDKKWSEKILEPPKFVNVGAFTELGMEVIVSGKTQPSEQWGVSGELRRRLLTAFTKHKIRLAQSPNAPVYSRKK